MNVQILEHPKEILYKGFREDIGEWIEVYHWGHENGYVKICCYGGTAFKKKCDDEAMANFIISPIINNRYNERQICEYCKDWERWDYYTEYFKAD